MPRVTPRTRSLVIALVGVGWLVLGLVNLSQGHAALGVFYCVVGAGLVTAGWVVDRARRTR